MSENISVKEVNEELKDLEVSAERLDSIEKALSQEAKEAEVKHSGERIQAKKEVEQAIAGAEQAPKGIEKADKKRETPHTGIKKQQYKVTMQRVEARLPAYQKAFSKVIHNRVVDSVSNVASKTIARPSGLLGGAIASFVGLLVVYLNARRVGFEYPVGATFIFFVSVGWLIGILLEYIIGAFKKISK